MIIIPYDMEQFAFNIFPMTSSVLPSSPELDKGEVRNEIFAEFQKSHIGIDI